MNPKMLKIHKSKTEYLDLNNNAITPTKAKTAAVRSPYAAGAARRGSRGEVVIPVIRKESPM
jgi:hypothetical protein